VDLAGLDVEGIPGLVGCGWFAFVAATIFPRARDIKAVPCLNEHRAARHRAKAEKRVRYEIMRARERGIEQGTVMMDAAAQLALRYQLVYVFAAPNPGRAAVDAGAATRFVILLFCRSFERTTGGANLHPKFWPRQE
jgi:hypothetical protein